jgi:RHS repeat-associated protein
MTQRTVGSPTIADKEVRKSRGHWHRESHARHRDYLPALGRFSERDPIGFEAGDGNWYRFVANGPTGKTDPLGLQYLSGDQYRTPTTTELGLVLQTLKGGAAYGDEWPVAKSFLAHALKESTIANPQGSSWTHTDGEPAVVAIIHDTYFISAVDSALENHFVTAAAGRLICDSPAVELKIPNTPVVVTFKDGDLHYAINRITFNISGTCKVAHCCRDKTCVSLQYSCDLNVNATDKYDFAWEGGSSSYLSFGRRVNNAAYAAQRAGKLGTYDNVFRFKHNQSGTKECPQQE